MQIFLLNSDTFKRSFLGGDGHLELASDQDIWLSLLATGGRFLPTIDRVADVKFALRDERAFRFGKSGGFNLEAGGGATHQIQLIWPGEDDQMLTGLAESMSDDSVCLRLHLQAAADVGATAGFPTGPISQSFGIQAGGSVGYDYFRIYSSDLTAKAILDDLFAGMRLPQQIETPEDLPGKGEAIILQYGGYLKLSAALNWGYKLKGTRSIEFNDLALNLSHDLKAMASLTIGYSLAGDFRLETRSGSSDGWVRLIVRKNRDSQFNLAADFSIDQSRRLKGLPRSADEFLTALIGADAGSFLEYFQKARKYESLDDLEKALTPSFKQFVHKWSQQLIGKTLNNQTFDEFIEEARKASKLYQDLDQRVIDLYRNYLDRIPALQKVLEALTAITNPTELLLDDETDESAEEKAGWWEVIQLVWGANVHPLLLEEEEFRRFSEFAKRARAFIEDDAIRPVRDLIAGISEFLPLDRLFGELDKIGSADELRQTADLRLQELAGRLIGSAFDTIRKNGWEKAFREMKSGLDRIEEFKNTWYGKMQESVNGKFRFDLHLAWSRARHDEELIDVELDLTSSEGRELARQATSGDFSDVLAGFNSRCIRINRGVFTHQVTTGAHLSLSVMGYGYESLRQLTQRVEETIEQTDDGLLRIYASETVLNSRKSSGRKFRETVECNLLLRAIGERVSRQGDDSESRMLESLRDLSVQYDFLETDERTRPEELTRYLEMAEFLGILDGTARSAFTADLIRQFPAGFGNVSVKYQIRYDDRAIRKVFENFREDEMQSLAQLTLREIIASKYLGMKQTSWLARVGFAYLAPAIHETFEREGAPALTRFKSVTLPSWHTGGAPSTVQLSRTDIAMLQTLCGIEKTYGKRIVRLGKILNEAIDRGKPVPLGKLKEEAKKFVEMLDKLDEWRENAFFATLDKLIAEFSGGATARKSAMILEITPPGGKKVTRVLMPQ